MTTIELIKMGLDVGGSGVEVVPMKDQKIYITWSGLKYMVKSVSRRIFLCSCSIYILLTWFGCKLAFLYNIVKFLACCNTSSYITGSCCSCNFVLTITNAVIRNVVASTASCIEGKTIVFYMKIFQDYLVTNP